MTDTVPRSAPTAFEPADGSGYKRVLLKLSGEAFGGGSVGVDSEIVNRIAVQLADGGGRLGGDAARALPSSMPAPPAWRARLTQRRQSSGERDGEEHRPGSAAREEAR